LKIIIQPLVHLLMPQEQPVLPELLVPLEQMLQVPQ
jgi:hypothetical protein